MRPSAAAAYRRLLSRAPELYAARRRHADALREEGLRVDTPDDRLAFPASNGRFSRTEVRLRR